MSSDSLRRRLNQNKTSQQKTDPNKEVDTIGDSSSSSVISSCDSPVVDVSPERKSLFVTFVLWLFGGVWGLHHLYLGRDVQSIMWSVSFGGFVLGWLRDAWMLTTYVQQANQDYYYTKHTTTNTSPSSSDVPPWRLSHLIGQFLFAYYFCTVLSNSILFWGPDPYPSFPPLVRVRAALSLAQLLRVAAIAARALAVTAGVTLTGNLHIHNTSSISRVFTGAVIGQAFDLYKSIQLFHHADEQGVAGRDSSFWSIVLAIACYQMARRNKQHLPHIHASHNINNNVHLTSTSTRRSSCARITRFMLIVTVFASLFTMHVLQDYSISDVRLKTSLHRFLRSQQCALYWQRVSHEFGRLLADGWSSWWSTLVASIDEDAIQHSFDVLQLDTRQQHTYTTQQVRKQRNILALKFHPDKHSEADEMSVEERAAKFTEIQRAYEKIIKFIEKRDNKIK